MLSALRQILQEKELDAYLLPMADRFQNEYVPSHAAYIQALCGFSGSAGTVAVTPKEAVLFTDGRYLLQAKAQVAPDFSVMDIRQITPADWLAAQLGDAVNIGADAWQYSITAWQKLARRFAGLQDSGNVVDPLWNAKPVAESVPVFLHDEAYAGVSWQEKWQALGAHMPLLLTDSPSICWLLNVRGGDVPCTPLLNAYALVEKEQISLFCDTTKISDRVQKYRPKLAVFPLKEAISVLKQPELRYDPAQTPAAFLAHLPDDAMAEPNPVMRLKACKNSAEQAGMRACHQRDGAALTRAMHWIKNQAPGSVSELDVVKKLTEERAKEALFHDISFPPIVGAGPNGAIIHYHADKASNRKLEAGELLLMDSGGQYVDGTTDVTRTLAIGTPNRHMIEDYTRVLKGHIALALAVFPQGTTGAQLDSLARQYLWQAGDDYAHGTGHGVGHFLGVHEGPQSISSYPNATVLEAGMILSNEPGIYREGQYGIRIENMVLVRSHPTYKGFLCFETLTQAPYEEALIDFDALSEQERHYLEGYL